MKKTVRLFSLVIIMKIWKVTQLCLFRCGCDFCYICGKNWMLVHNCKKNPSTWIRYNWLEIKVFFFLCFTINFKILGLSILCTKSVFYKFCFQMGRGFLISTSKIFLLAYQMLVSLLEKMLSTSRQLHRFWKTALVEDAVTIL